MKFNTFSSKKKLKERILQKISSDIDSFNVEESKFILDFLNNRSMEKFWRNICDKERQKTLTIVNRKSTVDVLYEEYFQNYFYNTTSDIYFDYTNKSSYIIVSRDDVVKCIIDVINEKMRISNLVEKRKISKSIFQRIKQNSIYDTIPESRTIQDVISILTPFLFIRKCFSKIFLTTIGDVILKKKTNKVLFINNATTDFMAWVKTINDFIKMNFHCLTLTNHIKFKFYNHSTKDSWLLPLQKNTTMLIKHMTTQSILLNLICVSVYYSNRYGNAERYISLVKKSTSLEDEEDVSCIEYVEYLQNKTIDNIINTFYTITCKPTEGSKITEDDMMFLWKRFLSTNNLPEYLIFKQDFNKTLQSIICNNEDNISFDESKSCYNNVFNINIPTVHSFLTFWKKHTKNNTEEEYLELEEICYAYNSMFKSSKMTIKITREIMNHYFPEIPLTDGKYINSIDIPWLNKKNSIIDFLKTQISNDGGNKPKLNLYKKYCKYRKENNSEFICSKKYFEHVISKLE